MPVNIDFSYMTVYDFWLIPQFFAKKNYLVKEYPKNLAETNKKTWLDREKHCI
jgi:hypothetical protein